MVLRIFLTTILLAGTALGSQANDPFVVKDKDRLALVALKTSMESLQAGRCEEVRQAGPYYSLDLRACLPARVRPLLGRTSLVSGPNCFNFALYTLGVLNSLRAVNSGELEFHLKPATGSCEKLPPNRKSVPGNFVVLKSTDQGAPRAIHGWIHLTDKYVLTKNGPETDSKWEISTLAKMMEVYAVAPKDKVIERYRCAGRTEDLASVDLPLSSVDDLGLRLNSLILNPEKSEALLRDFQYDIMTLRNELSSGVVRQFNLNKNDPRVRRRIFEMVSLFYTVKNTHYLLEEGNPEKNRSQQLAETYLDLVQKVVEPTGEKFDIEYVSNGEDSLEYDYCRARNWSRFVCTLGEH